MELGKQFIQQLSQLTPEFVNLLQIYIYIPVLKPVSLVVFQNSQYP